MKYLIFIFILVFSFSAFGQKAYHKKTENLFSTISASALDSNGDSLYYVTLTNADADTSQEIQFKEGRSGDMRISVLSDSVSGTTATIVDIGLKVGVFSADGRYDYIWGNSIITQSADWELDTVEIVDLGILDSPILAYKIAVRQTGTAVTRVHVQVIEYKP